MVQRQALKQNSQLRRFLKAIEQYRKVGQFHLALPLVHKAVRLAYEPSDKAEAYAARGLVERGLERYEEAIKWLKKARAFYRRLTDLQGEAYCLWGLGGCERFRGKPANAVRYFQKAQRKFLTAGNRQGWVYSAFGLAGALRALGKTKDSLRTYQATWQTCRREHDTFGTAYGLCGMAHAYRKLSEKEKGVRPLFRLRKAERWYGESGRLYKKIGDLSSVGYTEWGVGKINQLKGNVDTAKPRFIRAEKDFRLAKDTRGLALARLGLAQLSGSPTEGKRVIRWARQRGVTAVMLNSY